MPIPASLLTTTCDIYRPFGAASPTYTGIACRLTATLARGRAIDPKTSLMWTHTLDVQDSVDLRDGCTRLADANAITFADGDEVRVPSGTANRYVVVWVEVVGMGTPRQHQRAYLLRHAVA
jgi:hypothetical protein